MKTLSIVRQFSKAPGPRYRREGKNSGEEFREKVLCDAVRVAVGKGEKLIVDIDGTYGFATSFLEEAFGGLVRHDGIGFDDIRKTLDIKSDEEPDLIEEIWEYIGDAWEEKQGVGK